MADSYSSADQNATGQIDLTKVLVVIPTYNEADNIESIVSRIRKAQPQINILIADDNSPDGTGEIADRLAEDEHIHVLHRQGKEGLAAAYIAGFRWGLDQGYQVLVEHDADGSHQPEELHLLFEALESADQVKGSRYVPGGKLVNWPKSREALSKLGNLWVRIWLGIKVKDATGGFNAFRAETLRTIDLDGVQAAGYAFQVDLTWRVIQAGLKVAEVPITFVERELGASKMSQKIIVEAMLLVARWGIKHRISQLCKVFKFSLAKAKEVAGEAKKKIKK